jgi:hypothetical protein
LGAAHQTIRRGGYVALAQAELLVAATFDEQEAFVLHQKELAAVTPRADPREVARLVPAGSAHLAWLDTWFDREVIPGASGIHIYDAAISIVRQAIDSQERQAPASRLVNRRRRAGLSRAADGVGDLLRRAAFARAMVPYDPALGAQVIAAWNTFKDLGVPSVLPRFPDRLIWGPALPTQRRSFSFDTPEARWWTVVGTFLEDGGRWLDNSQVVIDRTPEQRAKESLAAVQDVLLRPDGARQALEGLFKLLVAFRFLDWVDRELGAIAPTEAGLALPRFSHRTAPGYRETTTSY